MGFVADFVEDVGDFVGDAFEEVGDVVENVYDVVSDVVETVGDVVQAVLDDPLPVLLSVAGSFIGIPPPITMGAITAANGGDLEDVVLSMGMSYITGPSGLDVGGAISSTVSSTFIEAGINETFSQVAGDAISRGLVSGTMAEIKGGDFDDGFSGGFVGGLVSGGVSEVASYVQPEVVDFAMDSGLDLRDSTALFNAGVRAVSAGVTSEVTGNNDFVTAFTASAISSGVDAGVRSFNTTIDEQFNTAATVWNEEKKDDEPINTTVTGAGIPDTLVNEVQVSDIGVNTESYTSTFDAAQILGDTANNANAGSSVAADNTVTSTADAAATSDISVLPQTTLTEAPTGETVVDFTDLISQANPASVEPVLTDNTLLSAEPVLTDNTLLSAEPVLTDNTLLSAEPVLTDNTLLSDVPADTGVVETGVSNALPDEVFLAEFLDNQKIYDTPETVADVTEVAQEDKAPVVLEGPKGALTTMAEAPQTDLGESQPAVVSEAPVSENLLVSELAAEPPVGGLNAVAQAEQAAPEAKTASSMGLKPTSITKPVVATVGNLLKQALTQKRPAQNAGRPAGGLKIAGAKPALRKPTAPSRMDVAKLIPIQKATSVKPAKKLSSTANLSPVSNIAGLTSLVKKAG